MKRLLIAIMLTMVFATACYAEDDATTVQLDKKISIQDLVGRTIYYTWQTGPFKNAAHLLMVIDPNTMKLSIESGMKMANPSTIKFEVIQVSNQIFYITWRSKEYGQTLIMTFNFKTNMIYEVVVTEKTNYLSQGPFVIKK